VQLKTAKNKLRTTACQTVAKLNFSVLN